MKRGLVDRFGDRPARLLFVLALSGLAITARAESRQAPLEKLIQQAHDRHLSADHYWRLLLHDHYDLFGRYQSEIDDRAFFLSPKGRRDPSAELDATLTGFFDPPANDSDTMHPQCRFPARYAWLKQQLQFSADVPEQPCPRFEYWRDQMNAESVTMLFASYYLNNPASMYGHTFLRLNAKGRKGSEHLLDYTINFAAFTTSQNGLLFALQGLLGGYRGKFSSMPYYLKVQEYNNLESRDLWEYSLSLTPEEVERMVRHLWELGSGSAAYYFFNKNCSYQLLPVLEVARPSLDLASPFWFKAIPADTLRRVITQPGLLTGVHRRPSHVSRMLAGRAQLNPDEIPMAEQLAKKADAASLQALAVFPADRQAKILDSAFDLFRYRTGFIREQPQAIQEQERSLLMAQNKLSLAASPTSPITKEESGTKGVMQIGPPDQGHPSGRMDISYGWTKHTRFEELSLRPAIHDQNDTPTGYVPGSQLDMMHLRLRYDNQRNALFVQEFTLIDINSLSAWDRWVRKPSWALHTGVSVANDLDRDPENSLYYGLSGGSGFSYKTSLLGGELFYAMAIAESGLGVVFRDTYRLGGGGRSGVIVDVTPWWRIHFNGSYVNYPLGEPGEAVKLQLVQSVPLGKRFQARATLERQNAYKELMLSVLMYL